MICKGASASRCEKSSTKGPWLKKSGLSPLGPNCCVNSVCKRDQSLVLRISATSCSCELLISKEACPDGLSVEEAGMDEKSKMVIGRSWQILLDQKAIFDLLNILRNSKTVA